MNVNDLQERLNNNPDDIIKVLIYLGFREETIRYNKNGNFISSVRPKMHANDNPDNPLGFMIYCDNLYYVMNTRSQKGNLFTLTMDLKHCNFPKALEIIGGVLNIKSTPVKKVQYPFQAFYQRLIAMPDYPENKVPTYPESLLPPANNLSEMYLKDGVSLQVQEKMGIRYSHELDATLVPIYTFDGKLMGCKARSNNPNVDHSKRFWSPLSYSKTLTLYGYSMNYRSIIKQQTVVIIESEKGVAQAASFDCYVVVALGGHSFSSTQVRYIQGLNVKNVIVAFDESIDEEEIIYECNKLKMNNKLYSSHISYIYDENHKYLPKGSKASPTDFGRQIFEKIIKECRKFIRS